jgi:hypothetical protein
MAGGIASAIQSDTFSDNSISTAWTAVQDDPSVLGLAETNQRLEFTFGDNPVAGNRVEAKYLSNGWSADLTADFAMKVDFNYEGPGTTGDRGVALGLSFNGGEDTVRLVCGSNSVVYYGYETMADGLLTHGVWWTRGVQSDTLYLSYVAALDEFYFSAKGFWAANATTVLPGYVTAHPGATSAEIMLSAYSEGTTTPLAGSLAYLDNFQIVVPSIPGDPNADGKVDLTDLGILATNWGRTDANGPAQADFTGDAAVNLSDLGILATHWGAGAAAVPEPMTLMLLAGGSIGLLARRRI